jgi:sulfate transport system ATP-binding protein
MSIRLTDLTKRYGAFTAVADLSLEIPDGQLVALLGPSGSGKTTLLRLIAGLEQPDAGVVRLSGKGGTRRVGFVFQHYALFKHMSVFENVAFGLRVRPRKERPSEAEIRRRVQDVLRMVHLDWAGDRRPDQLSGGQRQRIALARALAIEPEVLLLDEPFGALDAQVRAELRQWLRRLHDETGITTVFVTHDQEEALEVADRIILVNAGRIEQDGTPREVYERPASPFVYRFIGQVNRFEGRVRGGRLQVGEAAIALAGPALEEGAQVEAFLRPHELGLAVGAEPGALPATVTRIQALGPLARVRLEASHDRTDLEAHLSVAELGELRLEVGQRIFVRPRRMDLFSGSDGDWVI